MKINDIVTSPEVDHDPIFDDMLAPNTPQRVKAIYIQAFSGEGTIYSKHVDESNDPEAIVFLDNGSKYKLKDLLI